MRKLTAVRRLALRNLIFVMRKNEVHTARVNVNRFAEVFVRHCTALNVPAGTSLAPGAFPIRLALFFCFPNGEIHRIFLFFADFNSCACLKIFERLMRKFAVIRKLFNVEINVAVNSIGKSLFFKRLYKRDYRVDILRRSGMIGRLVYAERL